MTEFWPNGFLRGGVQPSEFVELLRREGFA